MPCQILTSFYTNKIINLFVDTKGTLWCLECQILNSFSGIIIGTCLPEIITEANITTNTWGSGGVGLFHQEQFYRVQTPLSHKPPKKKKKTQTKLFKLLKL